MNSYVENFGNLIEEREEEAYANILKYDRERLGELIDEQKRFTAAILAKMGPGEDNQELLSELETTITLISGLSNRHIYIQGLRHGIALTGIINNPIKSIRI